MKLKRETKEENAMSYLLQRISVAVQRGKAASILVGLRGQAIHELFLKLYLNHTFRGV